MFCSKPLRNVKINHDFYCFVTSQIHMFIMKTDGNVLTVRNGMQKNFDFPFSYKILNLWSGAG
jgi:hypothetical protein